MSTIRRRILRDVISRKTRTALVSLSVFIGVLGVVVLTTLGQLVTRQLEKDLVPAEMAMLRIYLDIPSGETLDNAAYLEFLREQPGVTAVEGQFAYQFQWKRPGQSAFQTGQLYAYSAPFGQIKLEPPRLVAGRYPTAGGGEVAVERRMAEKQRLKLGDTLVVQTRTLQEEPFRIVGIVFQPYLYFGSDDATTSIYAAAPDAQHILGFSGFSSIYVGFKSFPTARQESHAFRAALTKQTPYKINFYLVNDPQQNAFIVGVRQFSRVLRILAIVAIIVANFLVANVISTIVAEQRQQIGAMKALGATRLNILCLYLLMALVYGLIGTVPALLLGVPLGRYIAQQAAPLANTILENTTPPPLALLLGAALGLGTPMLAAIIPVYHGSRITILEAMTDQGITATYGKGLLPRLLNRLHLPMEIHQALNHTLHRKARLALTILSLSLAAAAFMGVFAVFHTLTSVVRDLRDQLDYDVSTDPSQLAVRDLMQAILTDEPVREIQRGVAVELHVTDPEIGGAVRDPSIPYETDPVYVTGIDSQKDLGDLVMVEGTGWADDPARRGIVITPGLAEQFGKTVGDTLHLQAPDRAEDFEIIGLADYPFQTAFMEWHQLADFVGIIRDAPIPNAYWEQVQIQTQEGGSPLKDRLVWAIGIDERVGKFLVPSFDPSTPGVIISQELAAEGGFEKGQPLALRPANLSLLESITDRTPVTYPITGIVGLTPQETALLLRSAPPSLLAEDHPLIIALYWPELASLVQLDYRTITPGTFSIDLANPANNSLTSAKPVTIYSNQVAFADKIAETLLSLGLLMSFASLLMALVGSIGLLTITSIGVFERQREIGVMRSVGATSRAITRQFLLEGLFIGWIAWLAGVPLSYALSLVLIHSVPFNQVIQFSYTPFAAIIGLAGMLAVTAAATLYPSLMAARKTVSEILRYQ